MIYIGLKHDLAEKLGEAGLEVSDLHRFQIGLKS